ncbi:hypothetical protein C8Q73DRAFT_716918 [Cubamyces lactineus]|nr:hypothetical protein C8Q73DRAFT_716918 [Cubamyces lactineus]
MAAPPPHHGPSPDTRTEAGLLSHSERSSVMVNARELFSPIYSIFIHSLQFPVLVSLRSQRRHHN